MIIMYKEPTRFKIVVLNNTFNRIFGQLETSSNFLKKQRDIDIISINTTSLPTSINDGLDLLRVTCFLAFNPRKVLVTAYFVCSHLLCTPGFAASSLLVMTCLLVCALALQPLTLRRRCQPSPRRCAPRRFPIPITCSSLPRCGNTSGKGLAVGCAWRAMPRGTPMAFWLPL